MYVPQFPYIGNQVIITSGRVTQHSYDDFIFLFGKKGVAISSPATFTVDANERTIVASPKIEVPPAFQPAPFAWTKIMMLTIELLLKTSCPTESLCGVR